MFNNEKKARTRATGKLGVGKDSALSFIGAEVVVTEQNLQASSMEALAAEGRTVRLIWKRHHVLALADH